MAKTFVVLMLDDLISYISHLLDEFESEYKPSRRNSKRCWGQTGLYEHRPKAYYRKDTGSRGS